MVRPLSPSPLLVVGPPVEEFFFSFHFLVEKFRSGSLFVAWYSILYGTSKPMSRNQFCFEITNRSDYLFFFTRAHRVLDYRARLSLLQIRRRCSFFTFSLEGCFLYAGYKLGLSSNLLSPVWPYNEGTIVLYILSFINTRMVGW